MNSADTRFRWQRFTAPTAGWSLRFSTPGRNDLWLGTVWLNGSFASGPICVDNIQDRGSHAIAAAELLTLAERQVKR